MQMRGLTNERDATDWEGQPGVGRRLAGCRRAVTAARARAVLVGSVALIVGAALVAAPGIADATTYKWVDEKGVVHYSDKLPPEAADKNRIELNAQGVPIKKSERPLSPEQQKAKERDEARAREVEKQREEIARRDRALVASYTTEKDIDLARDRAWRTLDAAIQSAESYAAQLKVRKADAEARKASYAGKPVPIAIERELESINVETQRQSELIARKKREAEAAAAKYEADKQRWRELVAAKGQAELSPPTAAAPPSVAPAGAVTPVSTKAAGSSSPAHPAVSAPYAAPSTATPPAKK